MAERIALPDGGEIVATRLGDKEAPPLLIIRPLGGSIRLWGDFRTELARNFQVFAFDPRGAGRSSAASVGMTTRSMAEDAKAVLDHFELKSAHVFGLSLGGMVATQLAAHAPKCVRKLILGSTALRGLQIWRSVEVKTLGPLVAGFLKIGRDMNASFAEDILSPEFRQQYPDVVKNIRAAAKRDPASHLGLALLLLAAAQHDATKLLPKVKAPTLVIAGAKDTLLSSSNQRRMAKLLRADFTEIPGCGHDLSLEKPKRTARLVSAFCNAPL